MSKQFCICQIRDPSPYDDTLGQLQGTPLLLSHTHEETNCRPSWPRNFYIPLFPEVSSRSHELSPATIVGCQKDGSSPRSTGYVSTMPIVPSTPYHRYNTGKSLLKQRTQLTRHRRDHDCDDRCANHYLAPLILKLLLAHDNLRLGQFYFTGT